MVRKSRCVLDKQMCPKLSCTLCQKACNFENEHTTSRSCLDFLNPIDEEPDTDPTDKFTCNLNPPAEAKKNIKLQNTFKKIIHRGKVAEDVMRCVEVCNDRGERMKNLFEKYNDRYQTKIEKQKAKLIALSRPKPRHSPWDRRKRPFEVRKSALKYKPTPRMLNLCKLRPNQITQKYKPPSPPKSSWRELQEQSKKWKALSEKQTGEANTLKNTKSVKKSVKKSTGKKSKSKFGKGFKRKSSADREKSLQKMFERLAQPRREFRDPTPEKKPPKPYEEIMKRTNELLKLAKPPEPRVDIDDFFKTVKPPADYQPSARLLQLAQPKTLPPEYLLDINYKWEVKKSALNYIPTERILKLAQPKVRVEPEPDFDPDAFKVKQTALDYKPTKRILNLAKPKVYPDG